MTITDAKEIDIVEYLGKLGFQPDKVNGVDFWYKSPLPTRDEQTASFKVNQKLNRWYDWGEGKGGNLIDLGVLIHQCSVAEFLQHLTEANMKVIIGKAPSLNQAEKEKESIQVLRVQPLQSLPLIRHLKHRRIPPYIYLQYCKEVSYELKGKQYYSIGFKNDAGGYELRNEYSKLSSSPKDITFIENGVKELVVFEGFFNFLSHRSMLLQQEEKKANFLILNSTSFFEKSLPKMMEHDQVHLYLDNDKTGDKFSAKALKIAPLKFTDHRKLYQKYEDVNDWQMHIGQSHKQRISQKP